MKKNEKRRTKGRKFAVIDLETNPFKFNRIPAPFAAGFFDGETYAEFWGDDCVQQLLDYIAQIPDKLLIYAHNGGKFDFYYLEHVIENPVLFIHSRLVKGKLFHHEIRDSFAIFPEALASFDKGEIEYWKFERDKRNKHRKEICAYLERDCRSLYTLCEAFIARYGVQITMPSNAMKELRKLHPQANQSPEHDAKFRPFYFGGRNECFEIGQCVGNFKVYDVNSMYLEAMRNHNHPFGDGHLIDNELPDDNNMVYFAEITATSRGALPMSTKHGLEFPHGTHRFNACSHELNTGIELGLIEVHEVHHVFIPNQVQRFVEFVDAFMAEKIACEEAGDKLGRALAKRTGVSAYGKFSANPYRYKDGCIFDSYSEMMSDQWVWFETDSSGRCWAINKRTGKTRPFSSMHEIAEMQWQEVGNFGEDRILAERPVMIRSHSFHDVAIGASITSAARAVLLRALNAAVRPIYCDTDSIICEELNLDLHPTRIGAWKTEATARQVFIAGKKLYCCLAENDQNCVVKTGDYKCSCGVCRRGVKRASKGARLAYHTIAEIAMGAEERHEIDAPAFKIGHRKKGKTPSFIARRLVPTGKVRIIEQPAIRPVTL